MGKIFDKFVEEHENYVMNSFHMIKENNCLGLVKYRDITFETMAPLIYVLDSSEKELIGQYILDISESLKETNKKYENGCYVSECTKFFFAIWRGLIIKLKQEYDLSLNIEVDAINDAQKILNMSNNK